MAFVNLDFGTIIIIALMGADMNSGRLIFFSFVKRPVRVLPDSSVVVSFLICSTHVPIFTQNQFGCVSSTTPATWTRAHTFNMLYVAYEEFSRVLDWCCSCNLVGRSKEHNIIPNQRKKNEIKWLRDSGINNGDGIATLLGECKNLPL